MSQLGPEAFDGDGRGVPGRLGAAGPEAFAWGNARRRPMIVGWSSSPGSFTSLPSSSSTFWSTGPGSSPASPATAGVPRPAHRTSRTVRANGAYADGIRRVIEPTSIGSVVGRARRTESPALLPCLPPRPRTNSLFETSVNPADSSYGVAESIRPCCGEIKKARGNPPEFHSAAQVQICTFTPHPARRSASPRKTAAPRGFAAHRAPAHAGAAYPPASEAALAHAARRRAPRSQVTRIQVFQYGCPRGARPGTARAIGLSRIAGAGGVAPVAYPSAGPLGMGSRAEPVPAIQK